MKRPSRVKMQNTIIKAVRKAGKRGATIDELSVATGLDRQTLSPRLTEIETERGAITTKSNGRVGGTNRPQTIARKGFSGRAQQVWFRVG